MAISEDLRRTLTDPTPLYAVAGTADLAVEKLREVPALLEKARSEAPERIQALRESADPQRVTERAKDVQTRFEEIVTSLDVRQVRDAAQGFALRQVGRAFEAAVEARETYDELAERGRGVVNQLRGEDEVEEPAAAPGTAVQPRTTSGEAGAAKADRPASTAKPATARPAAARKATGTRKAPARSTGASGRRSTAAAKGEKKTGTTRATGTASSAKPAARRTTAAKRATTRRATGEGRGTTE